MVSEILLLSVASKSINFSYISNLKRRFDINLIYRSQEKCKEIYKKCV